MRLALTGAPPAPARARRDAAPGRRPPRPAARGRARAVRGRRGRAPRPPARGGPPGARRRGARGRAARARRRPGLARARAPRRPDAVRMSRRAMSPGPRRLNEPRPARVRRGRGRPPAGGRRPRGRRGARVLARRGPLVDRPPDPPPLLGDRDRGRALSGGLPRDRARYLVQTEVMPIRRSRPCGHRLLPRLARRADRRVRVALAGGVAIARSAQRGGFRQGCGTSAAAMLQTVAIMGPARVGHPADPGDLRARCSGGWSARGHGHRRPGARGEGDPPGPPHPRVLLLRLADPRDRRLRRHATTACSAGCRSCPTGRRAR